MPGNQEQEGILTERFSLGPYEWDPSIFCEAKNTEQLNNPRRKARAEAFELMIKHAEELGANGIIGVRYDTTPLQELASEVLCYGTAVIAEPV